MRSNQTSRGRGARTLIALALATACAAVLAAPAAAVPSSGEAVIHTAEHDRGRTLTGQGGKLVPGIGTSADGRRISLPVPVLDPAAATAGHSGNLAFRKGKRGVALAGIHFDFNAGTLNGLLGGEEMAVFKLSTAAAIDPTKGSIQLTEAVLRFTPEAAKIVKQKLGLKRALRHNGVGMLWVYAQANPAQTAKTIASGSIDWGFRAKWREYVLSPPTGSIAVEDGATATGPLTSPATTYGFPATGGVFTEGKYGGSDTLALATKGAVNWAKPGHGIKEVRLSDLEVEQIGASAWLVADVKTQIGPPVESNDVRFAELGLAAVAPVHSTDGKTVTWAEIPATLTAEGAASFSGFYKAGQVLDPITFIANLG